MRLTALGMMVIPALTACGSADPDSGSYPSLHTVPNESRPSLPIKERRQIVRDLIDERDASREQTAIVRRRSGLNEEPPPSTGENLRAEDVIPDAAESGDNSFRLTSDDDEDSADSVYRTDAEADNGGLNDFIRQLERDTSPPAPLPEAPADPASNDVDEDKTSFVFPKHQGLAGILSDSQQIRLAAFVPGMGRQAGERRDVGIHFVADEDEPGFFCDWLGWSVAMFGACVDETDMLTSEESDEGVKAGIEDEARRLQEDQGSSDVVENEAGSEGTTSDEARREGSERSLSEEGAAKAKEAIEEASQGVLAPVTGSLEKLRDFIRARRSTSETSPSRERRSSLREATGTPEAAPVDRPPIPRSRPELREDIVIVDRNERFDFNRTPVPAFKPTPDLPVILDPEKPLQPSQKMSEPPDLPKIPLARPNDFLSGEREIERVSEAAGSKELEDVAVALAQPEDSRSETAETSQSVEPEPEVMPLSAPLDATSKAPDAALAPSAERLDKSRNSGPDSTSATSAIDEPTEPEAFLVLFEPRKPGLPEGMKPKLAILLASAKANDQKIYIYGEAGTNHLARRRATDVGAALVQLGATVEILEYDHRILNSAEQVRLVLKPAASGAEVTTVEPVAIE